MFVNGDAVALVVKLLAVGMVLLCLASVAHVVWLSRLARSPRLARLGPARRTAVVAFAAATPLVSFYGVEVARFLRRPALHRGAPAAAAALLGRVGAFAGLLAGVLVITQALRPGPAFSWPDVLSRLPGMFLVCAVPCAVLGMACQVLIRSAAARAGWLAVATAAAVGLFLLV